MTMRTFLISAGVRMTADWADGNPNMPEMMPGSSHYKCVLRAGRSSLTVYFSQGPAIRREPGVEDVLDCLASDASGYDNAGSFEAWAEEYGYNADSRKAESKYRAVERHTHGLENLLGRSAYRTLLDTVERL